MKDTTKRVLNIALSFIGIGVVIFYNLCSGTCSYLRGSVFNIDLKYIGASYMVAFMVVNLFRWSLPALLLASAALGIEFYLIGFQVRYWTFCHFCLAFGGVIIVQFILNFDRLKKWHMIFGAVIGLLFFILFFKGSILPTYNFSLSSRFGAGG